MRRRCFLMLKNVFHMNPITFFKEIPLANAFQLLLVYFCNSWNIIPRHIFFINHKLSICNYLSSDLAVWSPKTTTLFSLDNARWATKIKFNIIYSLTEWYPSMHAAFCQFSARATQKTLLWKNDNKQMNLQIRYEF